jgi:hypothetical protein
MIAVINSAKGEEKAVMQRRFAVFAWAVVSMTLGIKNTSDLALRNSLEILSRLPVTQQENHLRDFESHLLSGAYKGLPASEDPAALDIHLLMLKVIARPQTKGTLSKPLQRFLQRSLDDARYGGAAFIALYRHDWHLALREFPGFMKRIARSSDFMAFVEQMSSRFINDHPHQEFVEELAISLRQHRHGAGIVVMDAFARQFLGHRKMRQYPQLAEEFEKAYR